MKFKFYEKCLEVFKEKKIDSSLLSIRKISHLDNLEAYYKEASKFKEGQIFFRSTYHESLVRFSFFYDIYCVTYNKKFIGLVKFVREDFLKKEEPPTYNLSMCIKDDYNSFDTKDMILGLVFQKFQGTKTKIIKQSIPSNDKKSYRLLKKNNFIEIKSDSKRKVLEKKLEGVQSVW